LRIPSPNLSILSLHAALPILLFTHQNVALPLPWLAGWRRNRPLRRLRGAIAGSEGAAALVREVVPGLRVGVIPQLGGPARPRARSEEHTSELQLRGHLVCRLL